MCAIHRRQRQPSGRARGGSSKTRARAPQSQSVITGTQNDEEDEGFALSFFTAAPDLLTTEEPLTKSALAALRPRLRMLDTLYFSSAEATEALAALRETELKALIPPPPKAGDIAVSTLDNATLAKMAEALWTGPWAAAYPGLIEQIALLLGEALDDENPVLMLVRE